MSSCKPGEQLTALGAIYGEVHVPAQGMHLPEVCRHFRVDASIGLPFRLSLGRHQHEVVQVKQVLLEFLILQLTEAQLLLSIGRHPEISGQTLQLELQSP